MKKAKRRAATPRSRLKVGAWYQLHLGGKPFARVCVIALSPTHLLLEDPQHLLSSAETKSLDDLFVGPEWGTTRFKNYYNLVFLGYGKPRWFWGRVRRWTDCYGTLYTLPKP